MIPNFTKVHLRFKLNGVYYSFEDLKDVAYCLVKEGQPYEQNLGLFLLDWLDGKATIDVQTSGSTGTPKIITLKKQAMVNSAIATGDFFGLKPGDKALHCLPANFIAGKMMFIRALFLGLELDMVEPLSSPLFNPNKTYNFCAMTPMQLQNTYHYIDTIKTIIVGGAKAFKPLVEAIQHSSTKVYETYGMTETVTHIALKQLNNFESDTKQPLCFKILPNITISQDSRKCLVINAPKLTKETIVTNDIVTIRSENEFEWVGRFDNIINTGGVKVFPEQIEKKLSSKISERFFITSEADDTLGEKVVMVIENDVNELNLSLFEDLDKFERPKIIYTTPRFKETNSGKILRTETLAIAKANDGIAI